MTGPQDSAEVEPSGATAWLRISQIQTLDPRCTVSQCQAHTTEPDQSLNQKANLSFCIQAMTHSKTKLMLPRNMQTFNKRKYIQNKKMRLRANKIKKARWPGESSQPTKQSRGVLCSFLSSLRSQNRGKHSEVHSVLPPSWYHDTKEAELQPDFSEQRESSRLWRYIPLTLGKLDSLFPDKTQDPVTWLESSLHNLLPHSLLCQPYRGAAELLLHAYLIVLTLLFHWHMKVTDDVWGVWGLLKPTLCVSLRPHSVLSPLFTCP